jgi:hypothetical protein
MQRSVKRKRSQSGAVLVEGVIVAASMVVMFGCVLMVHAYCSLQLAKLDEARQEVWNNSVTGCGGDTNIDVKSIANQLKSGSEPLLPEGMFPDKREASRSFSVRGIFEASGRREIRFVCNPKPSQKTMVETVAWVLEVFI